MIKLKKLVNEILNLEKIDYKIGNRIKSTFAIGPDGIGWGFDDDDEYHGSGLLQYTKLMKQFITDMGFDSDDESIESILMDLAKSGDEELYKWMYKHNFIRGGSGWFAFMKMDNKQKDTIINIIEKNKDRFKYIDVHLVTATSTSFVTYSLADFWRKYLV